MEPVWGVESLLVPEFGTSFMNTLRKGDRALLQTEMVNKGDLVVVTAGIPEGKAGGTNVLKVHKVGE